MALISFRNIKTAQNKKIKIKQRIIITIILNKFREREREKKTKKKKVVVVGENATLRARTLRPAAHDSFVIQSKPFSFVISRLVCLVFFFFFVLPILFFKNSVCRNYHRWQNRK